MNIQKKSILHILRLAFLPSSSSSFTILHRRYKKQLEKATASRNSKLASAGGADRCKRGHDYIIDNKKHCSQMVVIWALMQQKEMLLLK